MIQTNENPWGEWGAMEEQQTPKRKRPKIFRACCLVPVASFFLLLIAGLVLLACLNDIEHLKGDEYLKSTVSPQGTYTVTLYRQNGDGATVGDGVLGVLTNNKTGATKNIFYKYHCHDATAQWLDDENVVINDIVLNVKKDVYDYDDHNE